MKKLLPLFILIFIALACKSSVPSDPKIAAEINTRKALAQELDDKWNLPGGAYVAAFNAIGDQSKTLSVSMSLKIPRMYEPSVSDIFDSKENYRQKVKKAGFTEVQIRHSDGETTKFAP